MNRRIAPALAVLLLSSLGSAQATSIPFPAWLADFRAEAAAQGISETTLARTLDIIEWREKVIDLDRGQPEFTRNFAEYLARAVSEERVADARAALEANAGLLREMERQYGVPPHYLVALWALETNLGRVMGNERVFDALATLAHEGRRATFFRDQLLDSLRIVERGLAMPSQMRGSWAGAMGHLQFMPGTYLAHAVDHNADGRIDVWGNLGDAFASAANYLADIGWKGDWRWGRPVRLPVDFPYERAELSVRAPLSEWRALGVRQLDGNRLPDRPEMASVVLPMGSTGPAFVVYDNFRAIMRWNASTHYALAVGILADRLDGATYDLGLDSANPGLRRIDDVRELQEILNRLGYEAGEPDGRIGPATRAAVRAFQRTIGMAPDGYPTTGLLAVLRMR